MNRFSTFLLLATAAALGLFLRSQGYGEVMEMIDAVIMAAVGTVVLFVLVPVLVVAIPLFLAINSREQR